MMKISTSTTALALIMVLTFAMSFGMTFVLLDEHDPPGGGLPPLDEWTLDNLPDDELIGASTTFEASGAKPADEKGRIEFRPEGGLPKQMRSIPHNSPSTEWLCEFDNIPWHTQSTQQHFTLLLEKWEEFAQMYFEAHKHTVRVDP